MSCSVYVWGGVEWLTVGNRNISRDSEVAVGVAPGPHEVTCEVLQETLDPGGGHEFRLISLTRSVLRYTLGVTKSLLTYCYSS